MKKFGVLAMLVAVLCLTGCGVTSTVSNNVTETKIVLSENNFKVVGQAYG
jgi:major membrane immunogen (membrane-anchored lipoprotein)